ncbi:MAG: PEP/pyruvate-binding domain-containing protein [Minisyncoccia bacterium]|jgi:pyruvate,water dikinase
MLYTLSNIIDKDLVKLGGKGLNLYLLTKEGLPIPEWFIIPADADLKEIEPQIMAHYNRLAKDGGVAVRSSANVEDAKDMSFAGQFSSYLNINTFEDLHEAIQKVRESVNSKVVSKYLKNNNLQKESIKMSVIVQKMICSDISGVMFTANPITANTDELIINSATGVDSVVKGIKANVHIFNKRKGLILDTGSKIQNGLNNGLLDKLFKIGIKIENIFNSPQDIEWAIKDKEIFILQSRPITKLNKFEEQLWDNSNISESYSGVTMPLTISFARRIYSTVYREVALTSGVSRQVIEDNKQLFDNMLGFFRGRFFYNMDNWYRLLLFFPAFGFTKGSMEQMMSVKEFHNFDKTINNSWFFNVRYILRATYRFFNFNHEIKSFKEIFHQTYDPLKTLDLSTLTELELLALYNKVESKILRPWHTAIDNDFLAMIFYGLLRKLTDRWGLNKINPSIYNDLLSGMNNVASAEQTEQLLKITSLIRDNKKVLELFNQANSGVLYNKYKQKEFNPELLGAIDIYLDRFGDRFANELKLEEPNIKESPEKLFSLIRVYLSILPEKFDEKIKGRNSIKLQAIEYLKSNLNPIKKLLIFYVLKQSERFLKNREQMRLMRAKIFGFIRNIFKEIGTKFEMNNIIDKSDDIFFLEIDEIARFIEGSSCCSNLKDLIKIREKEFDIYKRENMDDRFYTHGVPYLDIPLSKPDYEVGQQPRVLKGLPSSPGKAWGKVQLMEEFSYEIDGGARILITKHTDPGWTPIFSRFSGIIVENGGQLSHASIVSRELGIPCIVGIKDVTRIIKNGAMITMDGSRGELIIGK